MAIKQGEITVPAPQTTFQAVADFDAGFAGCASVAIMSASPAEVWVSFDGVNIHAHLVAGGAAGSWSSQRDYQRVWLRGNGAPVVVQVIVETNEE